MTDSIHPPIHTPSHNHRHAHTHPHTRTKCCFAYRFTRVPQTRLPLEHLRLGTGSRSYGHLSGHHRAGTSPLGHGAGKLRTVSGGGVHLSTSSPVWHHTVSAPRQEALLTISAMASKVDGRSIIECNICRYAVIKNAEYGSCG